MCRKFQKEDMKQMSKLSRVIIAIGSLALIISAFVPVWFIFLVAPQYPEGLTMQIWLNKITGQVDIINGLNHYIGMKHIEPSMFPEFTYLPYILVFFVVFGLAVAIIGKRRLLFAYLVTMAVAGVVALYDYYQWGYDYGHNLDPKAPIVIPGLSYQPPVIGHKILLNFDAYSYPDIGGWIFVAIASLFAIIWFLEFRRSRKTSTVRKTSKKQVALAAGLLTIIMSSCSVNPEPFQFGKDLCDGCRMTIMEPKFGGEIITKKGRIYKFDDVHCLVEFLKAKTIKESDIAQTVFINYENGKDWVEAGKTTFVVAESMNSPMNSNAAAFASEAAAQQIAKQTGGKIVSWNDLRETL